LLRLFAAIKPSSTGMAQVRRYPRAVPSCTASISGKFLERRKAKTSLPYCWGALRATGISTFSWKQTLARLPPGKIVDLSPYGNGLMRDNCLQYFSRAAR
jgi:hypothetical protein